MVDQRLFYKDRLFIQLHVARFFVTLIHAAAEGTILDNTKIGISPIRANQNKLNDYRGKEIKESDHFK